MKFLGGYSKQIYKKNSGRSKEYFYAWSFSDNMILLGDLTDDLLPTGKFQGIGEIDFALGYDRDPDIEGDDSPSSGLSREEAAFYFQGLAVPSSAFAGNGQIPAQSSGPPSGKIDQSRPLGQFGQSVHTGPLSGSSYGKSPEENTSAGDSYAWFELSEFFSSGGLPRNGAEQSVNTCNGQRVDDVLESNMRNDLAMVMEYLDGANKSSALHQIDKLLLRKGNFIPDHRFMFCEFGQMFRRTGLFKQSLSAYRRALELSPNPDAHLFFNIARVYFELGRREKAINFLEQAIEVKKRFREAYVFLDFIKKQR